MVDTSYVKLFMEDVVARYLPNDELGSTVNDTTWTLGNASNKMVFTGLSSLDQDPLLGGRGVAVGDLVIATGDAVDSSLLQVTGLEASTSTGGLQTKSLGSANQPTQAFASTSTYLSQGGVAFAVKNTSVLTGFLTQGVDELDVKLTVVTAGASGVLRVESPANLFPSYEIAGDMSTSSGTATYTVATGMVLEFSWTGGVPVQSQEQVLHVKAPTT